MLNIPKSEILYLKLRNHGGIFQSTTVRNYKILSVALSVYSVTLCVKIFL